MHGRRKARPPCRRGRALRAITAALISLALTLSLTGCSVAQPEKQALGLCVSIDRLADGRVRLALQAPVSKGGLAGEGAAEPGYTLLTADGATPDDALALLHQALPYPPSFTQTRLIVIGLAYAQSAGLHGIVGWLDALPGMRPEACVALCLGDGWTYLKEQKSDLGLLLSKHLDERLAHLRALGVIPDERLAALARRTRAGDEALCVPLCALNSKLLATQKESGGADGGASEAGGGDSPAFAGDAAPYGSPAESYWSDPAALSALAGTLPHQSENPAELYGAAVMGASGALCLLTGRETQALLALRGEEMQLEMDARGERVWARVTGCRWVADRAEGSAGGVSSQSGEVSQSAVAADRDAGDGSQSAAYSQSADGAITASSDVSGESGQSSAYSQTSARAAAPSLVLRATLCARLHAASGPSAMGDELAADDWRARSAAEALRREAQALLDKLLPLGLDAFALRDSVAPWFATEQALAAYALGERLAGASAAVSVETR